MADNPAPRCEPPVEAQAERWHWVRRGPGGPQPWEWNGPPEDVWRTAQGQFVRPEVARLRGYRWFAVAKPPDRP